MNRGKNPSETRQTRHQGDKQDINQITKGAKWAIGQSLWKCLGNAPYASFMEKNRQQNKDNRGMSQFTKKGQNRDNRDMNQLAEGVIIVPNIPSMVSPTAQMVHFARDCKITEEEIRR